MTVDTLLQKFDDYRNEFETDILIMYRNTTVT